MRIVFSAEGLARIRLLSTRDPVSETVLAARLFSRSTGAALFDRWRRSVRVRMGQPAQQIGPMAQQLRPAAELFRTPFGDGTSGTPGNTLLRHFHDTAVAPYRQAMWAFLEGDRTTRGDVILTAGVDGFLCSLHPLTTWQFPVLEIPNGSDRIVKIDERGLQVTPSLFHFDRPEVFGAGPDAGPPVLVYTPPVSSETAARLWDAEVHTQRALGALVGRTRSRLLAALGGGSSTTELGRRLGVSAASISQHTGVLREAGLITTQRRQNTVHHSLTPLGAALVDRAVARGPAVAGPALLRAS